MLSRKLLLLLCPVYCLGFAVPQRLQTISSSGGMSSSSRNKPFSGTLITSGTLSVRAASSVTTKISVLPTSSAATTLSFGTLSGSVSTDSLYGTELTLPSPTPKSLAPTMSLPSSTPLEIVDWTSNSACAGDPLNPSQECYEAQELNPAAQKIYFDSCSNDQKKQLAGWYQDGVNIALLVNGIYKDVSSTYGARYYMGPDSFNSPYNDRINNNLQRLADFKPITDNYVTITCKDVKNWCQKEVSKKSIGGYAYTVRHWYTFDHYYIHFCPPAFIVKTLEQTYQWLRKEISEGHTQYALSGDWVQNAGSYFIHEMMHTPLINKDDPFVTDVCIDPDCVNAKAYMPENVYKLAQANPERSLKGGAQRSTLNSDSYTQTYNALFWQEMTGYFPAVAGKRILEMTADENSKTCDESSLLPRMAYVGNITGVDDAGVEALLTTEIGQLSNEFYTNVTCLNPPTAGVPDVS